MSSFVAGFDGGGTKTVCMLADLSGRPMAVGYGGPGNVCTHPEVAPASCRAAWEQALASAGLAADGCRFAVFGLAGFYAPNVPGGPAAVASGIIPRDRAGFHSDMETALVGAVGTGAGVVVIAGTGSAACGRNPRGRFARAGGWGYILDDEGSAFWIARRAIRAALDQYDCRGGATALTDLLLAHLKLREPPDLERYVYELPEPNTAIAALAPLVHQAAERGDSLAQAILHDAGTRLSRLVLAVLRRLDEDPKAAGPNMPVATVGGVFGEEPAGSLVREALRQALHAEAPRATLIWPALPPVGGAVLLALQVCGGNTDEHAIRKFAAWCRAFGA